MATETSSESVSGPQLRPGLLSAAAEFVARARELPGVERIALIGSILTAKAQPKDIDLLVSVGDPCDLESLARYARRLQGHAQSIGAGADVFLSDSSGAYLGRTCPWRTCRPGVRAGCDAHHCGRRPFLHDDLSTVALPRALAHEPPVEIAPRVVVRAEVPADVASWLGQFGSPAT